MIFSIMSPPQNDDTYICLFHHNPMQDLSNDPSNCGLCGNDCTDGLWCNGSAMCNSGSCETATPVDCSDAVGCTDDACDEDLDVCTHTINHSLCDDGVGCTINTCDPIDDCVYSPNDAACVGGIACTRAQCSLEEDCVFTLDHGVCDDGAFCNGEEICDESSGRKENSDPCNQGLCDEENQRCLEDEGGVHGGGCACQTKESDIPFVSFFVCLITGFIWVRRRHVS